MENPRIQRTSPVLIEYFEQTPSIASEAAWSPLSDSWPDVEAQAPHFSLVVPGRPQGFQSKATKWNKQSAKAFNWAKKVRGVLRASTGRECLPVVPGACWHIISMAWFPDRRHCDPENVHKLAKDALFYKSGGGKDKVTSGWYGPPELDKEAPRVSLMGWWFGWVY